VPTARIIDVDRPSAPHAKSVALPDETFGRPITGHHHVHPKWQGRYANASAWIMDAMQSCNMPMHGGWVKMIGIGHQLLNLARASQIGVLLLNELVC